MTVALLPEKDILLAEDDQDDADIFEMALKELAIPHIMRRAHDGEVLFMLLGERIPYILFLDIHMPCRDGVACIVEIRKNRAYDNLPVVMYTSNLSNKIIEDCFRSGANLYLAKTNTLGALTDKLRKVFAINWEDTMHYPSKAQFVV